MTEEDTGPAIQTLTRLAETDAPMRTPKSAVWGWLELAFAVTLGSAVLASMLALLVAAENLRE